MNKREYIMKQKDLLMNNLIHRTLTTNFISLEILKEEMYNCLGKFYDFIWCKKK